MDVVKLLEDHLGDLQGDVGDLGEEHFDYCALVALVLLSNCGHVALHHGILVSEGGVFLLNLHRQ